MAFPVIEDTEDAKPKPKKKGLRDEAQIQAALQRARQAGANRKYQIDARFLHGFIYALEWALRRGNSLQWWLIGDDTIAEPERLLQRLMEQHDHILQDIDRLAARGGAPADWARDTVRGENIPNAELPVSKDEQDLQSAIYAFVRERPEGLRHAANLLATLRTQDHPEQLALRRLRPGQRRMKGCR